MFIEEIACALCGGKASVQFYIVDRGEDSLVVESISCKCGHMKKESSQIIEGKPQELRLEVKCSEQLNCRVVRGTRASVIIPEFGLCLDPTSSSQSFVTNVEGLLHRFKDAASRAHVLYDDYKSREKIDNIEVLLNRAVAGDEPFTIMISDPLGQSRLGD